jgi:hypothetical protein
MQCIEFALAGLIWIIPQVACRASYLGNVELFDHDVMSSYRQPQFGLRFAT